MSLLLGRSGSFVITLGLLAGWSILQGGRIFIVSNPFQCHDIFDSGFHLSRPR